MLRKILPHLVLMSTVFGLSVHAAPGDTVLIRTYCVYITKDKLSLSPTAQLAAATYKKLTKPESGGLETEKVSALERTGDFALDKKAYNALFTACQKFIHADAVMLDLKGTFAWWPESLSSLRLISVADKAESLDPAKQKESVLTPFSFTDVQNWVTTDDLASAIENNKDLLVKIAAKTDPSIWKTFVDGAASIPQSDYVKTTLQISAALALAWFGPAYLAGAVELLYPMVYGALFGVPSQFGLAYWLIYYPGKMQAMNWAFNNTQLIVAISSGTYATARLIGKSFYSLVNKVVSKEKLDSDIKELAKDETP